MGVDDKDAVGGAVIGRPIDGAELGAPPNENPGGEGEVAVAGVGWERAIDDEAKGVVVVELEEAPNKEEGVELTPNDGVEALLPKIELPENPNAEPVESNIRQCKGRLNPPSVSSVH